MNQDLLFVDTGYFVALVSERDELHGRALRLSAGLRRRLVTTEAVLVEVGNSLSRPQLRILAVSLFARLRANPAVEIVPVTAALFARAAELYAARLDKAWGMTDCISFVVMQDRGITEALAADHDFVQAGFRALLRD
jgi:uncharacterized protein